MSKFDLYKQQREPLKEHFSIPFDAIRAKFEVTDREIKGYPIVWNSKNDYGEILIKGSCANSLNARGVNSTGGNKITILLQHDTTKPLCVPYDLYEDEYGLFFRGSIADNIAYCDDAVEQIRQGILTQLSYGFNYVWDKVEYDNDRDAYILKEIKLYEISLVTFSSDPLAQLRSSNYTQNQMLMKLSTLTDNEKRNIQSFLDMARAVTNTQEPPKKQDLLTNLFGI